MAEPHWTSYVGMITGILGAIIALFSLRKSNKLKALDLRLELRKAINDIYADRPQLKELLDRSDRSRRNVTAARGVRGSGQMEKWHNDINADRARIGELFNRAPKPDSDYHMMNEKELESELVSVHKIQRELRNLREKYLEAIRSDNDISKQIREDNHVWQPPRT